MLNKHSLIVMLVLYFRVASLLPSQGQFQATKTRLFFTSPSFQTFYYQQDFHSVVDILQRICFNTGLVYVFCLAMNALIGAKSVRFLCLSIRLFQNFEDTKYTIRN